MNAQRILLIVGGGIAAYKTLELIRRLKERGVAVRVILTRAGSEFVTPLSLAALAEEPIFSDLFSLKDETEMGHIRLSREADLVVVAPATADLMAKMAAGLADDLASTALLATDKPVLIAPAMNVEMWNHPATQRNLARLEQDGIAVVGPGVGDMACGEVGAGRLAEVPDLLAAIERRLKAEPGPLEGVKALVTAGPTYERLDPIRYLANRSSGRQGYAIAGALARLGADTLLVSGPTALETPIGVERQSVESALQMMEACEAALPVDVAVCVAAVADWRPEDAAASKIKKNGGDAPAIRLTENPDILAALAARSNDRPRLVIGFAAETENVVENAKAKRTKKGCDWIVANDVSQEAGVMGGDENTVHLIDEADVESWPTLAKAAVAERLARRVAEELGEKAAP